MNLRYGKKMHMVEELTGDLDVCTLTAATITETSVKLTLTQGERTFEVNGKMGFGDYFNGKGFKIFDDLHYNRAIELSNAIRANKDIDIGQEVFYCDSFEVCYCGKVESFSNEGRNVVIINNDLGEDDANYMSDVKLSSFRELDKGDYFKDLEFAFTVRNEHIMNVIQATFDTEGLRSQDLKIKADKDAEVIIKIQAAWNALYATKKNTFFNKDADETKNI
jgi:hypothetical protein